VGLGGLPGGSAPLSPPVTGPASGRGLLGLGGFASLAAVEVSSYLVPEMRILATGIL
jgi:hypothetical protein